METGQRALVEGMRANARQWQADGSSFYASLTNHLAEDVENGGVAWEILRGYTADVKEFLPGLRLLDAVHRLVLAGKAPALAAHYPSTGGDGDPEAAWKAFPALLRDHAAELRATLPQPPQTNEVGRATAIVGGWLTVARETRLPLRLLEIGASAGLLLRADRYFYQADGASWGDPASPVRFVNCWEGGRPPLETPCTIAERRGCDEHPLNPNDAEGRRTLLAYVFPDETERFQRLRAALDVAATVAAPVDHAFVPEWVEANLAPLPEGRATVLFHSFLWQYLTPADAARTQRAIDAAAATATQAAPLARLGLEVPPSGDYAHTELRLTLWPGGEQRLLATCGPHPPPVQWRA